MKVLLVVVGGLVLGLILLVAAVAAAVAGTLGQPGTAPAAGPSATASRDVPAAMLALYRQAAAACPGLPWTVLAAIGTVESDNGTSTLPGVRSGANAAGAEGPMQFEPATFAEYDRPVPPGGADPPTPYDPVDAVYAAARDLCANGARDGTNVAAAVYAYNHSEGYVADVLAYAAAYAGPSGPAAAEAVGYALAQIGTPYVWGGETPGVGFDCSGLTQAAYAAAGIAIPRTSEQQWAALPHVPLDRIQPGDLIFFDPGEFVAGLPGHVGIYLGDDEMVDAPRTGTDVQIDSLADWPTPFGAARPAALVTAGGTS